MTDYYVKTNGNDNNAGTSQAAAWRTIDYGARQLRAGDTLYIGPGLYQERLNLTSANARSGTASSRIVVTALDINNKPKIRAGGTKGQQIKLTNLSGWTFDNLQFDKYTAGGGVHFYADGQNIANLTVQNCRFIEQRAKIGGQVLHVMQVTTRQAQYQARNIRIVGNYLYKCTPVADDRENGNELITFIGNVVDSEISNNELDQCYAIGINLIGDQWDNIYRGQPSDINILNNNVEISADPAWISRTHAQCMYTDRALGNILIANNTCIAGESAIAIAINMEPDGWNAPTPIKNTDGVILRDNVFITESDGKHAAKIGQGGTGSNSQDSRFQLEHCRMAHNVFKCGNSGRNYAMLFGRNWDLQYKNNIILMAGTRLTKYNPYQSSAQQSSIASDYNLWDSTGGSEKWEWDIPASDYTGIAAYRTASGDETNGQVATPTFADATNGDYTLASGSDGEGDGGALTLADGAGSSSTTLVVDDAYWFYAGCEIYIGSSSTERTVASVDPDANTIYLTASATWSDNDDVGYVYSGAAPSQGLTGTVASSDPEGVDEDDTSENDDVNIGLLNCDFDSGQTPWVDRTVGGSYTASVSSSKLNMAITSVGDYVEVYQNNLTIVEGVTYTATMEHVMTSGSMSFRAQLNDSLGNSLGLDEAVSATTSPDTESWEFTATGSNTDARMRLLFTNTGSTLQIDSFCITAANSQVDGDVTTVTGSIAAAANDGEVSVTNTTLDNSQTSSRIGRANSNTRESWCVFTLGAAIPNGATITEAFVDYIGYSSVGLPLTVTIYAEDASDATVPGTWAAYNGKSWLGTTASWVVSSWTWNAPGVTPDLSAVIQALIDSQSGLASGAKVNIRFAGPTTGTSQNIRFYLHDDTTYDPPSLTIKYTTTSDAGTDKQFAETFADTFRDTWNK